MTLRVRPAQDTDLPALLALGDQLRDQLVTAERGRGSAPSRALLEARYADALADRRRHVLVVVDAGTGSDEEVLGMAMLTVAHTSALLDQPAVHVNHAVVADRHRRRGAGRALVAAAAAFAEERGLEQVVVSVHPGSREANRFFARLAFAPVAVRRAATVSAIRRRLAAQDGRPPEHVVRRRRRPERVLREAVPPLPLVPGWTGDLERRDELGRVGDRS